MRYYPLKRLLTIDQLGARNIQFLKSRFPATQIDLLIIMLPTLEDVRVIVDLERSSCDVVGFLGLCWLDIIFQAFPQGMSRFHKRHILKSLCHKASLLLRERPEEEFAELFQQAVMEAVPLYLLDNPAFRNPQEWRPSMPTPQGNPDQELLEQLQQSGFSREQAGRLVSLHNHLKEELEYIERLMEERRREFIRWLVDTGRLKEDL